MEQNYVQWSGTLFMKQWKWIMGAICFQVNGIWLYFSVEFKNIQMGLIYQYYFKMSLRDKT